MFIFILLLCILGVIAGIGLLVLGLSLDFEDGPSFACFIGGLILAIGAVAFGIIWTIVPISKHMSAESCSNWAVQNQRPAKFATYTYWNWDCLTKTKDGHWISTSNYNAYISGQVGK